VKCYTISAGIFAGVCLASLVGIAPPAVAEVGRPVVVDNGGTYDGCYRSTDPSVPAVMIMTTDPVRIAGAGIEHARRGCRR